MQWHRLGICHRAPTPHDMITILHDATHLRSYYAHIQTCGSAWTCPVCAGVIYDHRRHELEEAVTHHRTDGGSIVFITLTARHSSHTQFRPYFLTLRSALRNTYTDRAWHTWSTNAGYLGQIRATEVTWSPRAGHHPHFHVLWFLQGKADCSTIEEWLRPRWIAMLREHHLSAIPEIGCRVLDATDDVGTYLTKAGFHDHGQWDITEELTQWRYKSINGCTPLDLLRVGLLCEQDDPDGYHQARRAYQQLAAGTFGTHAIRWGRGTRTTLGVGQDRDAEIASGAVNKQPMTFLATLTHSQWRYILGNDLRGEILAAANSGNLHTLYKFLQNSGCLAA